MAEIAIPVPGVTGVVTEAPNRPLPGKTGFKVVEGSSYNQYNIASVIERTYFFSLYFEMESLPTSLARFWHLIDSLGGVVCSLRVSTSGVLQMFDTEGNQYGASITLDLLKPYLIEPVVKQNAAGNGLTGLRVDKEVLNENISTKLTNTAWNRLRSGLDVPGVKSEKGFYQVINGLNDSTGAEKNSFVSGPLVFPAIPSKIIPSGKGRIPQKRGGVAQVNNTPVKTGTDFLAIRWVPNETMNLYRWQCGFNMEGVKLDELGAAAPEEIKGKKYGGKGREGYSDGNGGTIWARLCKCLPSGQPDLTSVLFEEKINAVKRYKEAHEAYAIEVEKINQHLFFNVGGTKVEEGQMYAWVFGNSDAKPLENFFSVNSPTTSPAAAGPHAKNTINRYEKGAMAGLDPREAVAWCIDSGAHWHWGASVGGDLARQGIVPQRAGGHVEGCYNGYDVEPDESVRLPWYGYQVEAGGPIQGIQPYYNYLETKEKAKVRERKVARTVPIKTAGGYAPPGKNVGVITVTVPGTGETATTAALGTGYVEGALSKELIVTAGETYILECSGTVYVAQADSFLQKIYNLGGGDWSITTDEMEVDRAELWIGEQPSFAELLPEPLLPGLGIGTLGSGTLGDPSEAVISQPAVMRERAPDKLAVRIDSPNGAITRWAEDETSPTNVLSDIEFSDEIPGGYKEMSGALARNPSIDYRDLFPYGGIKVYEPGGEVVWEGSLDKGPTVSGEQFQISPSALGYQYVLDDDNAVQVGFIDRDLSHWGDLSMQRKEDLLKAGAKLGSAEVSQGPQSVAGTLGPGVSIAINDFDASGIEWGETDYYSGGPDIAEVHGDFFGHEEDANWEDVCGMGLNDQFAGMGAAVSADMNAKATVTHFIVAIPAGSTGYKYALVTTNYRNAGFVGVNNIMHRWVNLVVIGNHGIAPQGEWPNYGYSAKQMLEYLIPKFGSPLTIDPEFVDDDGQLLTQAWYADGMPLGDIVNDVTKLGLYDWFVYHGKRFELRKPTTYGRFWKAYTGESGLNEVGLDSQRLWKKVTVRYTDASGITRTAGALGSGCDSESADLEITDPDHPATKAGRTRRDILDLQGIANPESAAAVGKRFLEEANLLNRSGSATLKGYVLDKYNVLRPAAQVKSGDYISFVDAADPSYRKIVNKSYRHTERGAEIDVDAPPAGMEALLERLQAGLTVLGVG